MSQRADATFRHDRIANGEQWIYDRIYYSRGEIVLGIEILDRVTALI